MFNFIKSKLFRPKLLLLRKYKKRTAFLAPVFVLFISLSFITGFTQTQNPPFEILRQQFESGKVLMAQFKYTFKDSFTNRVSSNTGTLWISRQKYKIISDAQTILVDGETSKVYDEKRNRLIISKYAEEKDDFAPSRILNGIDSTYTVAKQKHTTEGTYIIKLQSEDPFSLYKKITIKLNADYVPVKLKAVDRANNIIVTNFMDPAFIHEQPDIFDISYPSSAKIIDLRK